MAFELRNKTDGTIIHANDLSENDFNSDKLVENTFNFSLPGAEARVDQWHFNGIKIDHQSWHYTDKIEMAWKGNLDMVTMYFNMRGKTTIGSSGYNQPFELGRYQHNLFYSQNGEGTMKNDEMVMDTFMVQFSTDAFLRLTEDGNDALKSFGDAVLNGKATALSDMSLFMDVNILNAVNAIINCKYRDDLKKMFLLSKTIELLVLQAEAYNNILLRDSHFLKTAYDKERMIYAREYLIQHMDNPPSLIELARVTGVNEYKLKKGFKETFGLTVFNYLSETRLEQAKTELLEKNKTASQIAYELGYGSVQHFSTAFKKKFGVSPTMCN